MMRVIGAGLINFDQIGLNKTWIEKQIPVIVMDYVYEYLNNGYRRWKKNFDVETVAQVLKK